MKILILSVVLLLQQKNDSSNIWLNINAHQSVTFRDDRPVSAEEIAAIRKTLKTDKEVVLCDAFESIASVLGKLRFQRLSLSPDNAETVLVLAGPGCLRGGLGSNGAMWIVRLNRGRVTVLASPEEGFKGYIYAIPATSSKGYRDIVVGWHDSAFESGLVYFRFDGSEYHLLSRAKMKRDESGKETITPTR